MLKCSVNYPAQKVAILLRQFDFETVADAQNDIDLGNDYNPI